MVTGRVEVFIMSIEPYIPYNCHYQLTRVKVWIGFLSPWSGQLCEISISVILCRDHQG